VKPNDQKSFRRTAFLATVLLSMFGLWPALAGSEEVDPQEKKAWAALRSGAIVLLRHANAPGFGDPPEFMLGDCRTQRNLDAAGRAQARGIGARFRQQGVRPGKVLASQWCRTLDTAEAAFPGQVEPEPVFNSFFQDRSEAPPQTAMARALLLAWRGPSALVVVTHQVNITALSDIVPASGEGIVLQRDGPQLRVVGRIRP
jgi:phosphohistidine phosphatase SixA